MKKFLVPVLGFVLALGLFQFGAPATVLATDAGLTASGGLISGGDLPSVLGEATDGESSFRVIVKRIIDFILLFLGLIAVVMVIYGGFLYVTSAGNEEAVGKGKKILIYAALGIVIILISFALVNTLLGAGDAQRGTVNQTGNAQVVTPTGGTGTTTAQ